MTDVAGPAYPVQNRRDQLVELFPEYDIDLILESLPNHFSVEAVADWILMNAINAPKKRRIQKGKSDNKSSSDEEEIFSDEDEIVEGLVLNKLLKELYGKYVVNEGREHLQRCVRSFLGSVFPTVRMDFINKVYTHNRNVCSTMIGCWFVSNKCTQKLQDFINDPANIMWVTTDHIQNKRKRKSLDDYDDEFFNGIDATGGITRFKEIMQILTNRYPRILQGTKLLNEAFTLKIEIPEGIEMFECGVCFIEKTIDKRIMCGNTESEVRHSFCRTCLRGHASAAAEDMPLAEGAVGLKCMEFKCMNAIYYGSIRSLIPKEIRQRIDNRILEENLGQSGLNLERCRNCNYAVEMEETKEENKVFECQNCEKQWCRLCHREWNEDHFGISCAELDAKNNIDRRKRKIEERLNEVIVRKCGKCGLQMIKQDGCNKMTCRCGTTMCYICKKQNINYEHFCRHSRTPGINNCDICPKNTCTLWEDAQKKDNEEIERIKKESITVDETFDIERNAAKKIRSDKLKQVLNKVDQGQNFVRNLNYMNPLYPGIYPMINVQIANGQQQNFDFHQLMNDGREGMFQNRQYQVVNPQLFQRENRNEFGIDERNFRFNGMNYNQYGFLNSNRNFEQDRIQRELNRVNQNERINPIVPHFGMGNNGPPQFQGDVGAWIDMIIDDNPGNGNRNLGRGVNENRNFGGVNGNRNFGGNFNGNRNFGGINENRNLGGVNGNRNFGNLNGNRNFGGNIIENRNLGGNENLDDLENEIEISDDDDELVILNGNVRTRPERNAIQLAIDRLGDGAPAYELVPLGLENFDASFKDLVNDCNSIANFIINDCTQASEVFTRNFQVNHPENEKEFRIFREFENAQIEFAQIAKNHKAKNEVLLNRLQELRNRNENNPNTPTINTVDNQIQNQQRDLERRNSDVEQQQNPGPENHEEINFTRIVHIQHQELRNPGEIPAGIELL